MTDRKQIYEFAIKWYEKFRDSNIDYLELVDHQMADDCSDLGFEMDGGHAFFEKYGQAANDYEVLENIINDVIDIQLLGSAVYSRWRYFNHRAYTGAEILKPQNRNWFIIALAHLEKLSNPDMEKECKIILFPEFVAFIAGTTHIEGIEELAQYLNVDDKLDFFREPDNSYDPKAIVIKNRDGAKIGYVPREDNTVFSRLMDAGKLLFGKITAKETKGKWVKIQIGIYLHE